MTESKTEHVLVPADLCQRIINYIASRGTGDTPAGAVVEIIGSLQTCMFESRRQPGPDLLKDGVDAQRLGEATEKAKAEASA